MAEPLSLFLVAAEPSGDELGATLCQHLFDLYGEENLTFYGVGGPKMAAYGVPQPFDISELSVLGLLEGLKAYPRVVARADQMAELASAQPLDGAVLIDSWGFTLRVAQRLRKQQPQLPLIKYVAPQVWASRQGRARALAKTVDHVLTLQPFEPPYFERVGLKASFVGHPVLDNPPSGDANEFRERYQLGERKVLICLFGSRNAEWRQLSETFLETLMLVHQRYGEEVALIAPLSPTIATAVRTRLSSIPHEVLPLMLVDEPEKADAFAAADLALACSGTVVTQLAAQGVPAVVAYKLSPLGYALAKLYVRAPHISLTNMALNERAFPEYVQGEATPEALCNALTVWLDDDKARKVARQKGLEAVRLMRGEGGAGRRAAEAVLDTLWHGQP
jgi:lipid-A-disaccharide synthase